MKLESSTSILPRRKRFIRALDQYKYIYLMFLPVALFYLIFSYGPMYGAIIAFKDYSPAAGIWGSPWVGFKHFMKFFTGPHFGRLMFNTLALSGLNLLIGFPIPIILALLLNEIKNRKLKATVQTLTYFPHFISMVVVCGIIKNFLVQDGLINDIIALCGGERQSFLQNPAAFRAIYVISDAWQLAGWNSIVYLAAISNVDPCLHEACCLDGGGKLRQIWHVTLPGIMSTVVTMLILRIGQLMGVGFEKIILLYNPSTYSTADVISSYVYRRGIEGQEWSFSTAVGLFNSVINFVLIIAANAVSRKVNDTSLW